MTFSNDNYYSWDSSKLWDEYHTVYGLDENITWIKSNHSFKFGYQLPDDVPEHQQPQHMPPALSRSIGCSTAVPGDNSGTSGSPFASFHVGRSLQRRLHRPESRRCCVSRITRSSSRTTGRLHRRLTVNIGLRYEVNMGAYEKHDRLSLLRSDPAESGRQRIAWSACASSGMAQDAKAAAISTTTPADGDPVLGLAYQITDKTVIRAGARNLLRD